MVRVLVVEDEFIVAEDVRLTLVQAGHDVVDVVASGEEAVERAFALRPELLLMDVRLAGKIPGPEAARRITARLDVPVVYVTAFSDVATLDQAKISVPYGYLLKPYEGRELLVAVEMALHKHAVDLRVRSSERFLATTLRSIGDAVVATDNDGLVTLMNPMAERLTGWVEAEALGRPLTEVVRILDERSRDPLPISLRDVFAVRGVVSLPRGLLAQRGGGEVPVDDSLAPILDGNNLMGAILIFRDITERRRLEARIAVSERLVALGTMVAGIAHEMNNPLAYVIANVEVAIAGLAKAIEQIGDADLIAHLRDLRAALGDSLDGAQRVKRIVADLKTFSAPHERPRAAVDLVEVIGAAVRMAEHEIRARARLEVDLGPAPTVWGNDAQLAQVVLNLVVNAAHSIPEGAAASNHVRVSLGLDPLGNAQIEVSDTGCGIPPEVMVRMFDPFFTTKPVGSGTGLGLAICHRIVADHGGEIDASSPPQGQLQGTRFRVRLPASIQPPAQPLAVAAPPPVALRRGRILVVDDDPGVRKAIHRALHAAQDVVEAASSRAALELIAAGPPFDLILCDLMMPDLTGMDLYEALSASHPEEAARIVFMSGGTFTPRAAAFVARASDRILAKPFSIGILEDLVARWLR